MSESTEGNGSVEAEEGPARQVARPGEPPEAFARSGAEPPPPQPKRPLYKRPVAVIIFSLIVIAGIVVGVLWWLHARQFEETDDAFIAADVTQVSSRVAGHVDKIYITDNQLVQQHDRLVELDPRDFQAKVNEAQAAVVAAEKQLQQAKDNAGGMQASVGAAKAAEEASQAEANRAHNELARYEHLTAQAVTEQQMINLRAAAASGDANLAAAKQRTAVAQANVSSANAQIQVSQAQVDQAQESLKEAQLQLSYTKIAAPITGHVTNRSVNPGDYVQIGQSLFALVPQDVYVVANYKETQLDLMKPGQDVDLTVDAFPGHLFHGKVDSIQRGSGAAFSLLPPENATGNYVKVVQRVPVKITFNSDGYQLGPGMSVAPKVKVR